jgi:hypothetical protein
MFLVRFEQMCELPVDAQAFWIYFCEVAFIHVNLSALDCGDYGKFLG